ncbi:hypothetical protein GmHk_07G019791 [Glycine max]|nr:hypothetical protein GmHk_07G019791 [Glycine max]|eukprot:XP_025984874.1 uncharacterized protein LOC113002132 [Glycine max]
MFATSSSCLPSPRRDCHLLDGIVPMERSASSYNFKFQTRVMCLCNVKAPLVTLWTKDNPRRHFYGCGLYGVTGRKWCQFFEWHDPVVNSHEKRIIVALMKKVDELKVREKGLQTKINYMKLKGKILGIGLVLSWVIVCLLVFLLCSRGI